MGTLRRSNGSAAYPGNEAVAGSGGSSGLWTLGDSQVDCARTWEDFFKANKSILQLDKAVVHGHFDVLEWVVPYCPQSCRASLGDSDAARNGRLDILRLLRASGICDDGQYAMSSAASSGHLDIVKCLHNELKEAPAENGDLDIVQWLHENRSEGCTTRHGHSSVQRQPGNGRVAQ